MRNRTVLRLWAITEQFNTLHYDNWTEAVRKEVLEFQLRIVEETGNGYAGTDIPVYSWTFSGALLYSITVITTIGKPLNLLAQFLRVQRSNFKH